jgi:molecular chaperone DnaJ
LPPKDYYKVLGVSKTASKDEIRGAYRKLAKKYHPDRNPGDSAAEDRFKQVQEAYDVLGDETKKAQYDQMRDGRFAGFGPGGFQGFRTGPGGAQNVRFEDLSGFGDLGDLFSSIFGGGAGPGMRRGAHFGPMKGEDAHAELQIPFEQAVSGGKTAFTINLEEECSRCGGSGADPSSNVQTCATCQGRGSVATSQGGFSISRPCPACLGRGQTGGAPCPQCGGGGAAMRPRSISVKIPAGVKNGSKIRIAGQGGKGFQGGPSGDLILTVRVQAHPRFRREGSNVHSQVTLNLAEAVLGTTAKVETIDGMVNLRVPPGIQPGKKMRLKGKGVKKVHGDGRGDHIVEIQVELPKSLDESEKEAFIAFADKANLPH